MLVTLKHVVSYPRFRFLRSVESRERFNNTTALELLPTRIITHMIKTHSRVAKTDSNQFVTYDSYRNLINTGSSFFNFLKSGYTLHIHDLLERSYTYCGGNVCIEILCRTLHICRLPRSTK